MARWVAFAAIVTLLTAAMVWLSLLTQRSITPVETDRPGDRRATADHDDRVETADHDGRVETADRNEAVETATRDDGRARLDDRDADGQSTADSPPVDAIVEESGDGVRSGGEVSRAARDSTDRDLSEAATSSDRIVARARGVPITGRGLLLNVLATQGLFLALVIGVIVVTGVPADALGIAVSRGAVVPDLGLGLGVGVGLYAASECGSRLSRRAGVDHDEWLRESLAPNRRRDWLLLFGVVLPVIAIFEELLFRGVLIGAFAAGFGISPWLLAVGSSLLFAIGHGIQGAAGIVVTGVIGFALAVVFVLTESLLAVVTAHYLLNAFEFAVHELLHIGGWVEGERKFAE